MASSIILQILLTALFRGVLATLLDDAPEPYLAPQPRAVFSVVPPRVTGSISRPEGVISGRANSPLRHANGAIAHRDSDQVPFVFCPEDFNLPPKTCEQCGGDGKVPGQCDELLLSGRQLDSCWTMNEHCQGYYCSCTHGGEDHSPQITSTAVVNGDTATVVFEPKTLTEYTNLRASTTLTVTETTTTSDGDSGLETGTLVVFAGGVAWWAISEFGPAAALAAIELPEQKPDGSEDDDQECQSTPKEDCQDCGGADAVGLCNSGTHAGCPCDEKQHCPDQPPKCGDRECGGDNGSSQCAAEGAINGCRCCPDNPPDCNVDDCHGGLDQQCTAEKWSGCACQVVAADGAVDGTQGVPDARPDAASLTSLARRIFTEMYNGDYKSAPWWSPKPTTTTRVTPSDCSFVTTSFATLVVPTMDPVACWCECASGTMVDMTWGSSASSTSSWCLPGPASYAPDGWTQLPDGVKYCRGLPTATTQPPPTTEPPPPPPVTTTSTATYCDPNWCGAPYCAPCGADKKRAFVTVVAVRDEQ